MLYRNVVRAALLLSFWTRVHTLRPPGRRPTPTSKPFAPDADALDDFFRQLDPEAAVQTAETAEDSDFSDFSGSDVFADVQPLDADWQNICDAPAAASPEGGEWSDGWQSLDDVDEVEAPAAAPADAAAEAALDVLSTPRSVLEATAPPPACAHPALQKGDAVEVLCEDDGFWYQATLTEVGLGIAIASYGDGLDPEVVELGRVRVPAAPDDLLEAIQAAPEEQEPAYGEVDSHLLIERDARGRPAHAAYTYVDEQTCVGCYNCAMVAPATFFMEDGYGSARVFKQHGDAAEVIEEAIATCPVDCIHGVSFDELARLEVERRDQVINFAGRNMARASGRNIADASMTSAAGGRFSRVQDFEEIVEDEEFEQLAREKASERRRRARADVERITGARQTPVEL
mmetsp:Transcript_25587/g.76832  ORF Transcript_25587/g.76832 Transcript_25587/m.76832 type:complete len:401 (-) Transcript_25587:33-1235(-)